MLSNLKLAVTGAVALGLVLGAVWAYNKVWDRGWQAREQVAQADYLQAVKRTERVQGSLDEQAALERKKAQDEVRSINRRLADALGDYSMLQRSTERRAGDVPSSAGDCRGGTGTGLSGPDAAFLEREAARANTLRAALSQCYALHRKFRNAQPEVAE